MHPEKSSVDVIAFIQELSSSLRDSGSDSHLRQWAARIKQNDIALMDIISVIHSERKVAMRFSWMLGGIVMEDPKRVFPVVEYLFSHRHEIVIQNFERSLAKMFSLAGVPEAIEGEAVEALFQWLMDPQSIISTRVFAMAALDKLCHKHPELRQELRLVLEEIVAQHTGSVQKKALAILDKR